MKKKKYLHDRRLIRAFNTVPLDAFVVKELLDEGLYEDRPKLFYDDEEHGRTISAPHMICIMLENLALGPDDDLLILGAKSGYIAVLASCLSVRGEIFIIEALEDIVNITLDNLKRTGFNSRITVIHQNPLKGMPEGSPWQKILVTGQIEKKHLRNVLDQLDPDGGMLFAPIGGQRGQEFTQIVREGRSFYTDILGSVKFGPLEKELIFAEETDLDLIDEFDMEVDMEELERAEEIEFKHDKARIQRKLKTIEREFSIEVEKPKLTSTLILEVAKRCVEEGQGSCNLLEIANKSDLVLDELVDVIKSENFGYIKKPNPDSFYDAVLYLAPPEEENLKKIRNNAENILESIEAIENEMNPEVMKEYINAIQKVVEEIVKLTEVPIKKIKTYLITMKNVVNMISKAEEDHPIKNTEYYNLISSFNNRKLESCDELSDFVKKLTSK